MNICSWDLGSSMSSVKLQPTSVAGITLQLLWVSLRPQLIMYSIFVLQKSEVIGERIQKSYATVVGWKRFPNKWACVSPYINLSDRAFYSWLSWTDNKRGILYMHKLSTGQRTMYIIYIIIDNVASWLVWWVGFVTSFPKIILNLWNCWGGKVLWQVFFWFFPNIFSDFFTMFLKPSFCDWF